MGAHGVRTTKTDGTSPATGSEPTPGGKPTTAVGPIPRRRAARSPASTS